MKKLCELVDIVVNNENCVVFQPKPGTRMDFVALGCFKGNEEMIRMTKGRTPEITLFYQDGTNYSYHFGDRSTTVISDNIRKQREMIRECAILDFGIVCDWSYTPSDKPFIALVQETMDIKSLEDARRHVSLASGGGKICNIRVNGQTAALNMDVREVDAWFAQRGYGALWDRDITKGLPCGEVHGYAETLEDLNLPPKELESLLANATERANDSGRKTGVGMEREK